MNSVSRIVASIVIPAYNAAHRIALPLEALAAQVVEEGSFEVIIVDNASTDDTSKVALSHPATANLAMRNLSVRVVREERAGANHARIRGLLEARGEFICFLDDDIIPDLDFVAKAHAALADDSVGLLVSRVFASYQVDPPPSVVRRAHLLAINSGLGDKPISWGAQASFAPTITAALWGRRRVLLEVISDVGADTLLGGRSGDSLACSEDIELGYLVGRSGYDRVYNPALRVRHLIPGSRLQNRYFCRLIVGIVRSEQTLKAKYTTYHRTKAKLGHLAQLAGAVVLAPYLLMRRDGPRELLFVIVARWARLLGPYPKPNSPPICPH